MDCGVWPWPMDNDNDHYFELHLKLNKRNTTPLTIYKL